jgi:hypothetical protein
MATEATQTSLAITGTWTNLRSKAKTPLSLNVPASNDNQTGVMTGEDHSALTQAVADIVELWALIRAGTGRVVITQLPANPSQQDISDAFNAVYTGDIYDKDTVIDTGNGGFEWMYSNGTWFNLTEQPIPIATNTALGVVKGDPDNTAGKIYVEYDGTQSVIGWADLNTAIGNIASKLNTDYAYGASVTGNVLTVNLRNIFTGSETASAIDLPNAFTNVSYSGNTLTFTKADGTTQTQSIVLAMGDVAGLGDALAVKQDKLTAGANIQINGNIVSATDTVPNNGTLTIKLNGAVIGTFTANQSGNSEVNIASAAIPPSALGVPVKAIQRNSGTLNKDIFYYVNSSTRITVDLDNMPNMTDADIGKVYTFSAGCSTSPQYGGFLVQFWDGANKASFSTSISNMTDYATSATNYPVPVKVVFAGRFNNRNA